MKSWPPNGREESRRRLDEPHGRQGVARHLKVAINAVSAHIGGAVTYLANVVHKLSELGRGDQFLLLLPSGAKAESLRVGDTAHAEVNRYPFRSTRGVARLWFDQVMVPRILRRWGADVLFSSTGFGTLCCPCPQVLLVRNAAEFAPEYTSLYRETGQPVRPRLFRRWFSLMCMWRAEAVVFPTEAMRRLVQGCGSLDGARAHVIPYGCNPSELLAAPSKSDRFRSIDTRKSEGNVILLYVSVYAVHKGFEVAVEVLRQLKERGIRADLVTTTSETDTGDKLAYRRLRHMAESLGVASSWIEVGYVRRDELGALYRKADVYVYPSEVESFGHTLLEAMVMGLPVVAARTPTNLELGGESVLYFPPGDAKTCTEMVARVLAEPALRARLSRAAKEQAARFSWERHARELFALFRELAGRRAANPR